MAVSSRRWLLAGMFLLTSSLMACNPLTLGYFLMVGMDPKFDPKFKIAGDDKQKPVKVVIFTSAPLETRRELLNADRELTALFSQQLQEGCKRNKETNVVVASATRVQKFKDDNPMWQSMTPTELGKRLEADYVINLEIEDMSLFESGSQNTLFLGKTAISVTVVDVNKPDDGLAFSKDYTTVYPASGPRPVSETNPLQFRRAFLNKVANELSWLFTAHPTADQHTCE